MTNLRIDVDGILLEDFNIDPDQAARLRIMLQRELEALMANGLSPFVNSSETYRGISQVSLSSDIPVDAGDELALARSIALSIFGYINR